MLRLLLGAVVISLVSAGASAQETTCDTNALGARAIVYEGRFVVRAVDERRFFIAVDCESATEPLDGALDTLLLFTATRSLPPALSTAPADARVAGHFRLDDAGFELHAADGSVMSVPLAGLSWSRYWGYDRRPRVPQIYELTSARQSSACDHVPGSCWAVDGFEILFPH